MDFTKTCLNKMFLYIEICAPQGFSYFSKVGAWVAFWNWAIKLGKLELDPHFKWIKNQIRN